jgi:hypothetical protein
MTDLQTRLTRVPYDPVVTVVEGGFDVVQTYEGQSITTHVRVLPSGMLLLSDDLPEREAMEPFQVDPKGRGYSSLEFCFDLTFG